MVNIIFQTPEGEERQTELQEGESVLKAAKRIGLDIASICKRGDCGACQCDSHRLDAPDDNTPIRTCRAFPVADLKVFTEGVGKRRYRELFGPKE